MAQQVREKRGFGLMIALLVLFAASKVVVYDTLDPDCFWHMRVGGQLHRDGIGPLVDDLSFDSSRQPWTPYSWLAELGMKGIWDVGGYRAAVAVTAMAESAIILLLAMCCLEAQQSRGYLAVIVCTAIGEYLVLAYLSFRPVTFAFLLLFLIAWLMLRDIKNLNTPGAGRSLIWASVPLTVVLTNVHLFSFFVPAAMLAFAIGGWIRRDLRMVRRYSMLATLTLLGCLATPMLPGLIRTIFYYSAQDKMVSGPVIVEMQSFFRGRVGLVSGVGVAAMLWCIGRRYRLVHPGQLICVAGSLLLFLKLARFAPVFALAVCPALAVTLPALKSRLLGKTPVVLLLMIVVLIGFARLVSAFPSAKTPVSVWLNRHGPDMPGYPCEAADYLDRSIKPTTGHLINEFSWGGYLAWRLAGKYQVLLDGRTQVYPASLWQATYLGTDTDRKNFLADVKADAALLPTGKSLFRPALVQLGWTSVYKDPRAEILVPPVGKRGS